ncbi:MAG: FG-GAP repeat protein [Deltaproteobacteria bacterium]|nr:FG-GAP repeat protein [Deltaproteobacteria bacterium]
MTLPRPDSVGMFSYFGRGVAVDGDTAVISAPGVDLGEGQVGAFYVFAREPGEPASWSLVSETLGDQTTRLGERVDLSGDTALVFVIGEDGPCEFEDSCPTVRIYSRDHGGPGEWGLVTRVWPWDGADWFTFGTGLAIDGTAVFVGAPKAEPFPGPGSVYVYFCGDGSGEGDLCGALGIGAPSLTVSGRAALVASLALAAVLLTGRARTKRCS